MPIEAARHAAQQLHAKVDALGERVRSGSERIFEPGERVRQRLGPVQAHFGLPRARAVPQAQRRTFDVHQKPVNRPLGLAPGVFEHLFPTYFFGVQIEAIHIGERPRIQRQVTGQRWGDQPEHALC